MVKEMMIKGKKREMVRDMIRETMRKRDSVRDCEEETAS